MKRGVIVIVVSLLYACSSFDQNEFIETVEIADIGQEKFIYSAYKTGFDNYRIEFKAVTDGKSALLFDYYINDAVYTKERSFAFNVSYDTLSVLTPFQSCTFYHKSPKGVIIEMRNTHTNNKCTE